DIAGRDDVAARWHEPSALVGYTVGGVVGHAAAAVAWPGSSTPPRTATRTPKPPDRAGTRPPPRRRPGVTPTWHLRRRASQRGCGISQPAPSGRVTGRTEPHYPSRARRAIGCPYDIVALHPCR